MWVGLHKPQVLALEKSGHCHVLALSISLDRTLASGEPWHLCTKSEHIRCIYGQFGTILSPESGLWEPNTSANVQLVCRGVNLIPESKMVLLFGLGTWEIAVLLLLVLLIFGAKRIPEVARGLGKGIREFRSATSEISRELTLEDRPPAYRPPASQQTQNHASPPSSQEPSQSTPPTPPSQ